jgi:catechol 2,3-dioxygenase-like lactoylglutathione lyase family enzyme
MFKDAKAFSSFSVDNIDAAYTFYNDVLGLDVRKTPEGLSIRLTFGGNVFIYPKSDHQAAAFTVLNFQVPDIEKTVVDLSGLGVAMQQYDMDMIKTDEQGIMRTPDGAPGPRAIAWFKDPAGNVISVIQE